MKFDKLSDLCTIQIGKTPSRKVGYYWGKGSSWVAISDLKQKYICKTKEQITQIAIDETNCKVLPKGTLLMSFKLSIGKLAFTSCELFTNEAIAGLVIKDSKILNKNYLYYALKNIPLLKGVKVAVKGNTLNKKSLGNLKIPLPKSLDDQIKIANLLTQVESLISKREESIVLLDELLRSSFLDMFGDPVLNGKGWDIVKLESITNKVTDGAHKTPVYLEKGIIFISAKNIKKGTINFDSVKYISEKEHDILSKRCNPEVGDILLTKSGSLGASIVITSMNKPFSLFESLALIKFDSNIVNPYFFNHFLNSDATAIQYRKMARGVAIRHLHLRDIKKLNVMLPPKPLQDKFATIVEQVEESKAKYQKSLDELRDLFGALSRRAFRGELNE